MDTIMAIGLLIITSTLAPSAFGETAEDFGRAVVSEVERRVIRDYYREKYGSMERERGDRDRDRDRDGDRDNDERFKHKKKGKDKGAAGAGNPKGMPPGIVKKLDRGERAAH